MADLCCSEERQVMILRLWCLERSEEEEREWRTCFMGDGCVIHCTGRHQYWPVSALLRKKRNHELRRQDKGLRRESCMSHIQERGLLFCLSIASTAHSAEETGNAAALGRRYLTKHGKSRRGMGSET